ncbi:hypothetical protein K7G98_17825 [Saccharothrix sp. MB29]|nr:hypothetical protein [Saccharothrix sp. MB29]
MPASGQPLSLVTVSGSRSGPIACAGAIAIAADAVAASAASALNHFVRVRM